MVHESKKIVLFLASLTLLFSSIVVPNALAEEIVVTGNGAESTNAVTVASTNQTNVSANNTATITNTINATANTGNNTANENTGGSSTIVTGNVTQNAMVTNDANVSVVSQPCCVSASPATIAITDNGAHSDNTLTNTNSSQTNVTISNAANIINTLTVHANTGGNSANNNNGNVTIKTGNIILNNTVVNDAINRANISLATNDSSRETIVNISGNGAFSLSNITLAAQKDTHVAIFNISDILNNITARAETGNNQGNGNHGDVTITTGDVAVQTIISNKANVSETTVDCGCKKEQPQTPSNDPEQPVSAPAPSSASSGSSSSSSSSNTTTGAVLGATLPVTGNNFLILVIIGNILMLIFGAYLRLRSGNSPGARLAF